MAFETFFSIFTGSPQSRFAGLAIIMAVIVVSLVILFGKDNVPFSQKFSFVLLIFLISLPSILLSLFQLTCLVKGTGANNQRWWCGAYAWIISAILIIYCILLVFVAVTALITGEKVLENVYGDDVQEFKRNRDTATLIVQEYFTQNPDVAYGSVSNEQIPVRLSDNTEIPLDIAGSTNNFNIVQPEQLKNAITMQNLALSNVNSANVQSQINQVTGSLQMNNASQMQNQLQNIERFQTMDLDMMGSSMSEDQGNGDLNEQYIQRFQNMDPNMMGSSMPEDQEDVEEFGGKVLGDMSLPASYNIKSTKSSYGAMTDFAAYEPLNDRP